MTDIPEWAIQRAWHTLYDGAPIRASHERVVDIARALVEAEARGYAAAREQAAKWHEHSAGYLRQKITDNTSYHQSEIWSNDADIHEASATAIRAMEMSDDK